MMKMMLSMLVIILSIFMFFIKHPISMGLMILFQSLLICLLLGMFINSYWFSYILFLVFLGGLLVLFIYISSIASNEIMNFYLLKLMFFMFIFITFFSFMLKNNLNWMNFFFNEDMNNFNNIFLFLYNEKNISLFKLYNKQIYLLMIMMIIYLFITLIAVVKIINIFFGPLRTFN